MCPVPSTTRGAVMAPAWATAPSSGRTPTPTTAAGWPLVRMDCRCGDVAVTAPCWHLRHWEEDRVALTARLFVSSTFQDLVEERTALQEDALPRLRDLCRDRGVRLQVVDLRWGVS